MKHLQPFKEPPPPEKQSCRACKSFAPEVLVPDGDEAVPMCWLCAHHVVDHDASMQAAPSAECECLPHQIYPHRAPEGTSYLVQPEYMGRHSKRRMVS